jgi:hypothetical protein
MANSRDLILEVVRGERPLADLKAAGVSLRFRKLDRRSREINLKPHYDASLVVSPTAVDLAKGLLSYQGRPKDLKNWGSFVLGADFIELEPLESDPDGDVILNAVWDAGFEGRLSHDGAQAARRLVGQPTE